MRLFDPEFLILDPEGSGSRFSWQDLQDFSNRLCEPLLQAQNRMREVRPGSSHHEPSLGLEAWEQLGDSCAKISCWMIPQVASSLLFACRVANNYWGGTSNRWMRAWWKAFSRFWKRQRKHRRSHVVPLGSNAVSFARCGA